MNFSFCIITDGSIAAKERIKLTIQTIESLNIPNYEILCIGGQDGFEDIKSPNFKKFAFDETIKPAWITKKKNEIVKLTKYENLVLFHDYFVFKQDWYTGYKILDEKNVKWDIACNPILMINNARDYTDWVTWDHPEHGRQKSISYNNWSMTEHQYISGGYFLVKKQFMIDNPFNEELVANQEEDVEWSLRVRNKATIICNSLSIVQHTKWHRSMTIQPTHVG